MIIPEEHTAPAYDERADFTPSLLSSITFFASAQRSGLTQALPWSPPFRGRESETDSPGKTSSLIPNLTGSETSEPPCHPIAS